MIGPLLFWLVIGLGVAAVAQDRMPAIPADKLTEAQKKAAVEFAAKRGTPPLAPFVPLLPSPEVMQPAEAMGQYLQFKTVLPAKLREFVILLTGRQWTQGRIWNTHLGIAVKAGLSSRRSRKRWLRVAGPRQCPMTRRLFTTSVMNYIATRL